MVLRSLILFGLVVLSSPALSKVCHVYADLADQSLFLEQGPDIRLTRWEQRERSGFMDFFQRWWGRRYAGFRDFIIPSQETFPWFHISSDAETAAVIQTYLHGVEGRSVPESEMDPAALVRQWLAEYNGFEARKVNALERGFRDLFNERQFEKAISLAKKEKLEDMDKIVVDRVEIVNGAPEVISRTYRVRDIRAFEKRSQESRYDYLGKQHFFPLFRSKEKAVENGTFKRGRLLEIETKQAELYRRLFLLRYRMENLKDTMKREGHAEDFKPHQDFLTQLNVALGAEGKSPSRHAQSLLPSDQAMKIQLRREMWKQVQGWRSSQSERDKSLKDHVLTGLLNPTSLTDLGMSDTGNTRKFLKFLFNPRVQFVGLGLTTVGGVLAAWWQRYKETFRPDLQCAEQGTDAAFVGCVNEYMKNYFGREWVETKLNVEHVPFENQARKETHREKLRWFWKARAKELERRKRLAAFNKPTVEGLGELKAEWESKQKPTAGEPPPPPEPPSVIELRRREAALSLLLYHQQELAERDQLSSVAADDTADPLTRKLAGEKAEQLNQTLQGYFQSYLQAEPDPTLDAQLQKDVEALIDRFEPRLPHDGP